MRPSPLPSTRPTSPRAGEPAVATVTLLNDDVVDVTFDAARYEVDRGDPARVVLTLSKPAVADLNLWVTDQPRGGTRRGADYEAGPWTVTLAAGEKRKALSIPTTDDADPENDETFAVSLSARGGWTCASSTTRARSSAACSPAATPTPSPRAGSLRC